MIALSKKVIFKELPLGVKKKIENAEIKKHRIIYLDLLRVVCTLAVVILHTSGYAWSALQYDDPLWKYANFYNGFFRFSVPIFIMISGIFMLSDQSNFKKLYCEKILRLVKLFFVYSFLYAMTTNIIYSEPLEVFSLVKQIVLGHYHLWYIFTIIGLYIITPLLKEITKNDFLIKYFIILAFIFEILFGTISSIFKTTNFNLFFIKSYFFFVRGFIIYYILGHYMYRNKVNKKNLIYIIGIVSTIVTLLGTQFYSSYMMENSDIFYSFLGLTVFFQSLAIFVFFKEVVSKITFSIFFENVILALSKYSLGVYLIHVFFLIMLSQMNINCLSFHPLFAVPLISIAVFVLSFFLVYLFSKTPIIKYILY